MANWLPVHFSLQLPIFVLLFHLLDCFLQENAPDSKFDLCKGEMFHKNSDSMLNEFVEGMKMMKSDRAEESLQRVISFSESLYVKSFEE